jgi:hypothetical protein
MCPPTSEPVCSCPTCADRSRLPRGCARARWSSLPGDGGQCTHPTISLQNTRQFHTISPDNLHHSAPTIYTVLPRQLTAATGGAPSHRTTSRLGGSRREPSPRNALATRRRPSRTGRRAHHAARRRPRPRLADRPRLEGHRRRPTVNGARLQNRHPRRERNRSGLPWHRNARRARDRPGVCGRAGNPYLP